MEEMYKVFVFVPESQTDQVIQAMAAAGAGTVGKYTHCAYITQGLGNWLPEEGANPTIGEVGKMSRESENKVEMVCPKDKLDKVIAEIMKVHPYESPTIDAYEIKFFTK